LVEGQLLSQKEIFRSQSGTGSCTSGNTMHAVRKEHTTAMAKIKP